MVHVAPVLWLTYLVPVLLAIVIFKHSRYLLAGVLCVPLAGTGVQYLMYNAGRLFGDCSETMCFNAYYWAKIHRALPGFLHDGLPYAAFSLAAAAIVAIIINRRIDAEKKKESQAAAPVAVTATGTDDQSSG